MKSLLLAIGDDPALFKAARLIRGHVLRHGQIDQHTVEMYRREATRTVELQRQRKEAR